VTISGEIWHWLASSGRGSGVARLIAKGCPVLHDLFSAQPITQHESLDDATIA